MAGGTDLGTDVGSEVGGNASENWEAIGEDIGVDRELSVGSLWRPGICISRDVKSNGGSPDWSGTPRSCSSLSFAITEPDPFFGPLFFLAISRVHVRRLCVHLYNVSVRLECQAGCMLVDLSHGTLRPSHLTFRLLH